MNGIILTGKAYSGKSTIVKNISQNVKHYEAQSENDMLRHYFCDIISMNIGSLRELPKFVPETYRTREKFTFIAKDYEKPLIIVTTNLEIKQEDCRHWKVIEHNSFIQTVNTVKQIELYILQYMPKSNKIRVSI